MSRAAGAPTPADDLPHEAYLAALASLDGVGPARMRWLLSLGRPKDVWDRVREGLRPSPEPALGITAALRERWRNDARALEPDEVWQRCVDAGVGVVAPGGASYPPALSLDPEPPLVLFHQGDPDVLDAPRVAIIGTRRATGYGLRTAELLGRELAEAGVVVVSGLALGIDAAAHRGAIAVQGAPPAAVVGGGLDAPCPARNLPLAIEVARRGVVLSEVPPGVPAAPWRFPVRNRILAALGQVVVVVESAAAGGSMHTVREALARDRTVLAVPGPIDSRASEGTNLLLSEGAHPCLSTDDVLMALGRPAPSPRDRLDRAAPSAAEARPRPGPQAAAVLEQIGWRPATVEQLALRTGLDFRALSAALGDLEATGWIARNGGWVERVAKHSGIAGPRAGGP